MKAFFWLFLLLNVDLTLSAQDVSTPQKRMEVLDLARNLLSSKPIQVDAAAVADKNPFDPQTSAPVADVSSNKSVAPVTMSDRDLLINLSGLVNPTGSMRFGDTPIILFGQKKLKVGDVLPIVFQGITRELVISSIEPTSFTLRLNNEEITRPIKPSANKP